MKTITLTARVSKQIEDHLHPMDAVGQLWTLLEQYDFQPKEITYDKKGLESNDNKEKVTGQV